MIKIPAIKDGLIQTLFLAQPSPIDPSFKLDDIRRQILTMFATNILEMFKFFSIGSNSRSARFERKGIIVLSTFKIKTAVPLAGMSSQWTSQVINNAFSIFLASNIFAD